MSREWYALQVYSGHEAQVQKRLELLRDSQGGDYIVDIRSPVEERIELRQGKKRKVSKRFLPGYVFIELDLSDQGWKQQCAAVRSLQSVVGFVGQSAKGKPHPVPADEIKAVLQRSGELSTEKRYAMSVDFSPGETLRVVGGPFEGFNGTVDEVHPEKERMKVMVVIFGRPTPVDLDYSQVEKLT